ncbi:MAG: LPXTG cell wall anchor domain-containing protein [Clostridia bacterium]|nr:LPXTG cell wall anchor domain-containing protein [Clostridia bacterium]
MPLWGFQILLLALILFSVSTIADSYTLTSDCKIEVSVFEAGRWHSLLEEEKVEDEWKKKTKISYPSDSYSIPAGVDVSVICAMEDLQGIDDNRYYSGWEDVTEGAAPKVIMESHPDRAYDETRFRMPGRDLTIHSVMSPKEHYTIHLENGQVTIPYHAFFYILSQSELYDHDCDWVADGILLLDLDNSGRQTGGNGYDISVTFSESDSIPFFQRYAVIKVLPTNSVIGFRSFSGATVRHDACENFRYNPVTFSFQEKVREVDNISSKLVETSLSNSAAVPASVQNRFSSVSEIKTALFNQLPSNAPVQSQTKYIDLELRVLTDGKNWVVADEKNFPDDGLLVTLPYPVGVSADHHSFQISHMITQHIGKYRPGDIETPPVTKTKNGLQVRFHGLSPVAISWSENKPADLPSTGDSSHFSLFVALIFLCGVGLLLLNRK